TVLFYFFGHGGVVRFTDGPAELRLRPVFYLSLARRETDHERIGLLDVELSQSLRRMDSICQNVTAILDCCHSAHGVRGREVREGGRWPPPHRSARAHTPLPSALRPPSDLDGTAGPVDERFCGRGPRGGLGS